MPIGGRSTRTASPVPTSQTRIVLSFETEISSRPSGVNRTFLTIAVWPPVSSTKVGLLPASAATAAIAVVIEAKTSPTGSNRFMADSLFL